MENLLSILSVIASCQLCVMIWLILSLDQVRTHMNPRTSNTLILCCPIPLCMVLVATTEGKRNCPCP